MSDTSTPAPRSFVLDDDIKLPDGSIAMPAGTNITVRKPSAGELRGLSIASLLQLDVSALETIAPRITMPIIHKPWAAVMAPSDMTQLGTEVVDFLLPKSAKPASPTE